MITNKDYEKFVENVRHGIIATNNVNIDLTFTTIPLIEHLNDNDVKIMNAPTWLDANGEAISATKDMYEIDYPFLDDYRYIYTYVVVNDNINDDKKLIVRGVLKNT